MHEAYSDTTFSDFFVQAEHLNFDKVYVTEDYNGTIYILMNMFRIVMLEKEFNYNIIGNNLLQTICSYLEKYVGIDYKYPFVNSLKNTILTNLNNPLFDLSAAIERIGYNKDYLRRCFERDLGKTPLEYMIGLKINKAKALLIQSDFIGIKNVSERCGFTDTLYFSTVFKRKVGISPSQYRKKILPIIPKLNFQNSSVQEFHSTIQHWDKSEYGLLSQ